MGEFFGLMIMLAGVIGIGGIGEMIAVALGYLHPWDFR